MSHIDSDNEALFHTCVINSRQSETEIPKRVIISELESYAFSREEIFAVKLALEEALTNAVRHGNAGDSSKRITVRYAVNEEKAVIVIRDEGNGFAPEEVPDPTAPERIPLPSGRGIMLMRTYMDEVSYRDGGREVRVVKRRA